MGVRFIRQPSDTPNISNSDDARLFRYALGGQNGFIKGYGSELNYAIDGTKFVIQKGIAVLQGYEIEVDSGGWNDLDVGTSPTLHYFTVYCEVNLVAQTASIRSEKDIGGYPSISAGDDLTANTDGTAQMVLYKFTAKSGLVSSVVKLIEPINYSNNGVVFTQIPSDIISTIASLVGNGVSVVQASGTLAPGWYEAVLIGAGGGGGRGDLAGQGGTGGFLEERFFVPHQASYKMIAGGGGYSGYAPTNTGGGGGGGSVLDIPQLGILMIASGGGGGCSSSEYPGGGGGGYGSGGGSGFVPGFQSMGGYGGGGGGHIGTQKNGGGMGGGMCGTINAPVGGSGGGSGGSGGSVEPDAPAGRNGQNGGNNANTDLGEGAYGGNVGANGGNGAAQLYKLG